jgi:aryl-alcohol dehydrogenase-like predicted oxidoreductase
MYVFPSPTTPHSIHIPYSLAYAWTSDARNHGLRPFSVYQGRWSAADRDFEREILPMAAAEGMALCPWGALGGGKFTSEQKRRDADTGRDPNFAKPSEKDVKISQKLESIASKKNTALTSIALAYIRAKYPYVYPIVGGRKIEHLKGNIEALGIELSDDEVEEIDSAVDFDVGFPMNFLFELFGGKYKHTSTGGDVGLLRFAGNLENPPVQRGPKPHGLEGYGNN